jgi:flagellar protein FlbD
LILLTQLNGDEIYINPNLIETVESKPDTVIGLTTGKKIMVRESREEVVRKFVEFAAKVSSSGARDSKELQWT